MIATLVTLALLSAGPKSEALPFDVATLKAQPRVELKVVVGDKTTTYSGVPLARLLKAQMSGANVMADLRKLSDGAIILRAKDDYVAVVSAVEAALDEKGEKYLIAFDQDGKPLSDEQGPAKLIVPGDSMPVRWVRMISSITLVRIGTP